MTVSAGWCWLVVISAVDVILPIDELHHFSRCFLTTNQMGVPWVLPSKYWFYLGERQDLMKLILINGVNIKIWVSSD